MNYIGSKQRLLPFIKDVIDSVISEDMSQLSFCDLFAGSGKVGRYFKPLTSQIISNDIEYYSYVLNRHHIANNTPNQGIEQRLDHLNHVKGVAGFIFHHYCKGGKADRQYFSDANGMKIDAIRQEIEQWKENGELNDDSYFHLLAALLHAADKVANTASVYGAYLKHLKKTAQQTMHLKALEVYDNKGHNEVYNQDSNQIISTIKGDILYLDPPYNARQYGANYHILNTIARYDTFIPKGKTGQRNYQRSNYCKKNVVLKSFEHLIQEAQFKYIFLSYNNEGIMNLESVKEVMSRYGTYDIASTDYKRFKADADENRNHKATRTQEYLHILKK